MALGMTKDEDYLIRKLSDQVPSGTKHKNVYFLTPKAFKLCFIRGQNYKTDDATKYADYYLFLEEVISYYSEYQTKWRDSRISEITEERDDANATVKDVLVGLRAVLKQGEETNKELKEAKADREAIRNEAKAERAELKQKMTHVVDLLKQKSVVSTMNPANPKLHHNFVAMGYEFTDPEKGKGRKLAMIAGQEVHVRKSMREKLNDDAHTWTTQIGMHYNANPIDLRNNIAVRVKEYIKETILKKNAEFVSEALIENERIKAEIAEFNRIRSNDTPKRVFSAEKIKPRKITKADVPIKWNKQTAVIFENGLIDYDEIIELIRKANEDTQKSPYASDNEQAAEPDAADDEVPADVLEEMNEGYDSE